MSVKIILPGGLWFLVSAATEFITPQKSTKILSEDLKKSIWWTQYAYKEEIAWKKWSPNLIFFPAGEVYGSSVKMK